MTLRAVDVFVDAPGTTVSVHGMLTNGGFSRLRREPGGIPVSLVRFADAYPVSEFRVRRDFEEQAAYAVKDAAVSAVPQSSSRAVFVSALAIDSGGLATLRKSGVAAEVALSLDRIALPLNQAVGGSPARPVVLTMDKGTDAARLAKARDVMLWVEYDAP